MMKTVVKQDGVITFDGLPFVELPVAELLALPSQEASGKGIVIVNERTPVNVSGLTATHSGVPVSFTVTIRVERTPMNATEDAMVVAKQTAQSISAAKNALKETNARKELITAVQGTAVQVAKEISAASRGNDPISSAVNAFVADRFGGQKQIGQ